MLLNKLNFSLACARQTDKTRQTEAAWRWKRHSFMEVVEPIRPIYPNEPIYSFQVERVKDGELTLLITLNASHGSFNILTPKLPRVNVGTVGHIDWPTVNLI